MNCCSDLSGLSCSGKEIKTSLTISETCTPPSPPRSPSGTLAAGFCNTKEHQFGGGHRPATSPWCSPQPWGTGAPPAALGTVGARICLLSGGRCRRVPSRSLRSSRSSLQDSDLQVLRVPRAWGRGERLPLATGRRAVAVTGWGGVQGAHPVPERGEEQARDGERAAGLPVSSQKCCCSSS